MIENMLKELNVKQRQAVTFGEGPLLILAGAGSGKTRALTYRAAYLLLEKEISANRILLVTFTNKAAGEMKERIKKLVNDTGTKHRDDTNLPFAGTFHSFCAKLLREYGHLINIPRGFTIYDEGDSLETIKQALLNLDISVKDYKPRAVKSNISGAKNELISALEYNQYRQGVFQGVVTKVYIEYQRLLNQYDALDFDDLLFMAVKLLKKQKEVLNKLRDQFMYVLVDEYQDTNKAQYDLTKMLASKWKNLCAVGDFSQSIYSFRGADFRNLKRLESDFPNLTIINLEQNYRSTKNILSAANQVIEKNTSHPILRLWTEAKGGKKLKVFEAENEKEESGFIVKTIKKSGVKFSDIAILYRTNAQSRVIEEALMKSSIPYTLVGGTRFYSRMEIKDCLAYLRFLNNPKDRVSYKRLEKIGKRRLKKFLDWVELKDYKKMNSLKILDKILEVTGYLEKYNEEDEEDLVRLENIKELSSVAMEFGSLTDFLENVALVEQTDLMNKKKSVTLMTLHASKGLEFKMVFMIGMEEGMFPHSRSLLDSRQLEEERRLCYVGMTRAKKRLYFSYAKRRLYFGSFLNNSVSRFLGDIEEGFLEIIHDIINLDDY
ncbi:MAG: UvrD-helicase domain-containing protein [Patescibacteria group bacterium]|nr:UvrD-helicase domain-containing protein [Patescibacteria group bacterium]